MTFQEAEERYAQLRRQWRAGQLTPAEFQNGVAALRMLAPDGTWWTIRGQDGAWLHWNGASWLEAIPPHRTSFPTAAKPRRWWRTCLIILLVFACGLVALAGGGYLAVRSGRISALQMTALIGGVGEIKIINTSDSAIFVQLDQLGESEGGMGVVGDRFDAFDIGGFGGLSPGRYQIEFDSDTNSPPTLTCTIRLDRNDTYQFVAAPQGIAVVRHGGDIQDGAEMDVATSSLCRQ